ncbi:GntR family transcriptional regulator [Thomasclavelia saccharogumia]|uniref:GntR family transcriptional regulator n=1 Tax=Thomasclavelia saccharogumia TaxID=341225 RepID=UPI00047A7CAF|nr:GntR family transcriptional regulator [Thomasclavelia saccharogumia]
MDDLFQSNIIDKNSAIPLYYQLYTYIEQLIKENKLVEGDRLPPEDELVKILKISRPTIRQAYKELSTKGYIQRKRSKGTVVTKPKVLSKFLSELTNYYNELSAEDMEVKTKVLQFEITKDQKAREILNANKLIHLTRLRYSDNVPLVYIDTYLPYDSYQSLFSYDLEKESLYESMKKIGRPVESVKRIIKASQCSKEVADYLEIETKEPILYSQTIGKDKNEEPVEYSIARYNGAIAQFQIELRLND